MRRGIWYAVGAYTIFGFFPLYWKLLEPVPALQTVSHRILWSCVFLLALIIASDRKPGSGLWRGFPARSSESLCWPLR